MDQFVSKNRNNLVSSKAGEFIRALLSIPKTIYFNFRALPFRQAIKLPIIVLYNTNIVEIHKGIIEFSSTPYRFMVKIGFSGSEGIVRRKQSICFESGKVIFGKHNVFSEGISLRNSGTLLFGNEFYCNRNCTIWSSENISFGDEITLGWDITMRDCDGHMVVTDGKPGAVQKPITIGNHVWICSKTDILKGAGCGDNCVIGYQSLLTKKYDQDNVLIAGHPAKVIRENVNWVHG